MKRLLAFLPQPFTGGFLWHQPVKEMDAIRHRSELDLRQSWRVFHYKAEVRLGSRRRDRSLFTFEGVRHIYAEGYGQRSC